MSEWREYILKDIIDTFIDYRGKTPQKSESGIPLVTAKVVKSGKILTPNEFITEDEYEAWMTRGYPKENDVVLTTEAPLGEVALIKDENIALAQRIITMRGDPEIVSNVFLKYYFQSVQGQYELNSRASGTTVFGIKASVLRKAPVLLPELEEQHAIASVLSSLDDKIDLLHRQNQTLEQMAETLFRQWFPANAGQVMEEAEEEWEEGVLGDWATNPRESVKPEKISPDTPYVAMEHISKRNISLISTGDSSKVKSNKYRFNEGDILFGKFRPYFHKVCFTPFSGVCSTDILVIRPKKQNWLPLCLFAFFQDDVIDYATAGSGGTRMPRTNWGVLSSFPFLQPPQYLVDRFNELVSSFLHKIKSNRTQIRTLTALRDTLLPKLMSGEVRVKINIY